MARHPRILMFGLPALAAVALMGTVLSMAKSTQFRPTIEPRHSPPLQPTLNESNKPLRSVFIGATGLVEPSSQEVRIGTDVSGTIEQVLVGPGSHVKRGDPLFVIDRRIAKVALAQRQRDLAVAQARLNHARARLAGLEAELEITRSEIEAARAESDEAEDMVQIADRLKVGSAITQREADRRKGVLRASKARLNGAHARYALAEANRALMMEGDGGASIAVELATVEQAKAVITRAETELGLRIVRAPIDGTVLQINVRMGEYALAATSLQGLIIMGQLQPLHVRVDIDEADVPRYNAGGTVTASLRGESDRTMQLSFVRLEPLIVPKRALSGQATERVDTRVMQVIYAIEKANGTVRPGQQLDVFIEVTPRQMNTTMVPLGSVEKQSRE